MFPSRSLHTPSLPAVLVGILLLTLLGLVRCPPAYAADDNGMYLVFGHGFDSCSGLIHDANTLGENRVLRLAWLGGYLSAMHKMMPETYRLAPDLDTAMAWVVEYCRRNQDNVMAHAAEAYVMAAYPTRLSHAPAVDLPSAPRSPARQPAFPALPEWQQPQSTTPVQRKKR